MIIINTRPKNLSSNLKNLSKDQGIKISNIHLSKIVSTNLDKRSIKKIENIHLYNNIIFTSQNSVINGLEIIKSLNVIDLLDHNILTTGPATSDKLLKKGIQSIFPNELSSEGILGLIRTNFPGKSLLFCGNNSNRILQDNLGKDLDEILCYEVIYLAEELKKINNNKEIVLIYNFGTIKFLIDHLDETILKKKIFIVASENIKKKLRDGSKDLEVYVSSSPSDEMMIEMVKNFI